MNDFLIRALFATLLLASLFLMSIVLPKIKEAKYNYEQNCPCKEYYVGQMVTIKIDGRSAIVYSKYCYSLELKYYSNGRYKYDHFKPNELE